MKRLTYITASKRLFTTLFFGMALLIHAQEDEKNKASYEFGNGLNFSFNEGDYKFGISGFIQPSYFNESISGEDAVNEFNSKRTFLQFEGAAIKEKVSFFIQLDYSLSDPLMDAWLAYQPFQELTISFGQKQTFVNNREMTYREDRLQFNSRSFLSQNFSETGRELGLFISSKFGDKIGIAPMFALTSGDGRNSFGEDSRDSDLGGIKIGGRLDLYPLGYFKEGNDLTSTDLGREDNLKLVIGVAASQNYGASGATGEGHGDFFLYNADGDNSLPDYSQLYIDLLLKYKGFSFLAEYANAAATDIDEVYVDENATQILAPGQISEFLVLGDSYHLQLGYVTKNGYSFDVRYENSTPEFETNTSLLMDASATTFGFSKYFYGNSLKLQSSYSIVNPSLGENINQFEVLIQIAL